MEKNLIGQKFNRWTVIGEGTSRLYKHKNYENGYPQRYWLCKCECGTIREVSENSLINGKTKSCGCFQKEVTKSFLYTHKKSKTRIYGIWCSIKERTRNNNSTSFVNYGGRGISVCEEWSNSFDSFYKWSMENGYNENLSIDRINVNGNYEPSNCRWIAMDEQARNKRNTVYITYNGQTFNVHDWSFLVGVPESLIKSRYHSGWNPEDILFKPYSGRKSQKVMAITENGEELIFNSKNEAIKSMNVTQYSLEKLLNNETVRTNKYKWKYVS